MTHTTLFKNEVYLVVMSVISIGVLGGYAYFDLALAALITLPVINLPDRTAFSKENFNSNILCKFTSCK